MKIKSLQTHLLSYVFPKPITMSYYGGTRQILKRDAAVIRVEADNGLVGYAPGEASPEAADTIAAQIAPFLQGRLLRDADAIRVQFLSHCHDAEARRLYNAVEVALYDLLGKYDGAPVSEYLGGRVRDRIACYGSAGMYMAPEGYAAEAAMAEEMGFRAYKMRPAAGPEADVKTVEAMREATSLTFGLMVDAHAWWRMGDRSYSEATVLEVAKGMAEYDITWLEEPLPPHEHEAYRRLKAEQIVPIASGEHEESEESFLDLIQTGCVDYVQSDVAIQTGFALGRKLFAAIEKEGLRYAFHSWGTELELAAAAQIGVCYPESVVEWLEYPLYTQPRRQFMYEFPIAQQILAEPMVVERGDLLVPRTPGLGVTVDERAFAKFPWVDGPWSTFTLTSPPGTFAVTGNHSNTGLKKK